MQNEFSLGDLFPDAGLTATQAGRGLLWGSDGFRTEQGKTSVVRNHRGTGG